ncbi:MAG: hypothetical protein QW063_02620 [Candidatus Nanoarchaeia archaeon]
MAKFHSLLLMLLIISTINIVVYAEEQPIKIGESLKGVTFESLFQGLIDQICPSGSAFDCRALDFIIAFGVVFAVIFLGLNMVETFTRAGAEAQKALNIFALLAALSTAFYVWMQKIPFFSIMASFSLFFVGLIIILAIGNLIVSRGQGLSRKALLIGGVMIAAAALLFYFNQPVMGAGLFLLGLLITIIAFLLLLIKGGGPLPPTKERGPPPPDEEGVTPQEANIKRGLIEELYAFQVLINSIKQDTDKLFGIIHYLGKSQEGGFFAHIEKPEQFKPKFLVGARNIIDNLNKNIHIIEAARTHILNSKTFCAGKCSKKFERILSSLIISCNMIISELATAKNELAALENYVETQKPDELTKICKQIKSELKKENKGLKAVLKRLGIAKRALMRLTTS